MLSTIMRRMRTFFTSSLLITAVSVTTTGGAAAWSPPVLPARTPPPYAQGKVTTPQKSATSESKLLEKTFGALGTPYEPHGGTPAEGFSSAGFTKWAYSAVAVALPVTAQGQWFMGNAVSKETAHAGTLVYAEGQAGVVAGPDLVVWASEAAGEVIASSFAHFSSAPLRFASIPLPAI